MDYDLQFERFRDIYDFDRVINERPNNDVMSSSHSSQKSSDWSGTSTYNEAEELLVKGWSTKVEEMKNELAKFSQKVERTRNKREANIAGYAPIVPAAIKGVPNAMWTDRKIKKSEKKNYLHIYFNNNGTADVGADELMRSGMTVLKLCIILEKMGIKTKIDILPFVAQKSRSVYGCCVPIKDYRQPFNLQKMAYPIAHTSIFRRQGFKWLETMNNCTEKGFSYGYGGTVDSSATKAFKEKFHLDDEGSVYITYHECKSVGFEPEKLANLKGVKINNRG